MYLAKLTVFGIAELHWPARCVTICTTLTSFQSVLQVVLAEFFVIVVNHAYLV